MKTPLPSGIKPIQRFTRVIFILAVGFATVAGIQLYILADHTDQYFAWTINQPLSAAFLGAVYWSGAALFIGSFTEQAWSQVRIAVTAVGSFVVLMLIITLLHLDRFHLHASDPRPFFAAWAWMAVYVIFPLLLIVVLIIQRRVPGGDAPRAAPLSRATRLTLALNGAFSLIVCVALFIAPPALFSIWPWPLTTLTARAVSSGFLIITAGSWQMLRENAWERNRIGGVSYLVFGLLQFLALARYASDVAWDRPATWVYLFFMATVVYGGVYIILRAWGPLAQRARQARP